MDILLDPNVTCLVLLGGIMLGISVAYFLEVVRREGFVLVVEESNPNQS